MTARVVITGASSFVGVHLATVFHRAGWKVVGTHSRDIEAYSGVQADRLGLLRPEIELRQLDIRDPERSAALLTGVAPDLWVHHGGYADNYGSIDYDWSMASSINVAPLYYLYPAFAASGTRVIITGSSAEYSDCDDAAKEDDACLPTMPYGLSKLSETLCARQLSRHYGVPTRVARLFIPFGAYDNPDKLIATVISSLKAGVATDLSSCNQTRDFIGIGDVCTGYLRIAENMGKEEFDIYNLSSGKATELRALLLEIAESVGASPTLLNFGTRAMRPGEPEISYGDNSKARADFEWSVRPLPGALRDDLLDPKPLFA